MSIRLQLLVIALTTLLLPWAGCQYARELESTLRMSQENSLQAAAATIANALSAQPQRVFGEVADSAAFDPALGDLYVYPLHNQPLLDGYREDWNLAADPTPLATARLGARVLAGFTERYLSLPRGRRPALRCRTCRCPSCTGSVRSRQSADSMAGRGT